jgi:hypothetical protein
MGSASSPLLSLRPVTFRFKKSAPRSDSALQFGLIAEEVAEASPELATFDDQGRPTSVRYWQLAPLLLNEMQKQNRRVDELERARQTERLLLFLVGGLGLTGIAVARGRNGARTPRE